MSRKRKPGGQVDPAAANFQAGCELVNQSPLLNPLWRAVRVSRRENSSCPADGWAVVTSDGVIEVHPTRRGDPEEWAYVLAHCLLHLGFGHFDTRLHSREWNDTCDWFLASFQRQVKLGRPPAEMTTWAEPPGGNEEAIYAALQAGRAPADWHGCGAAGSSPDMRPVARQSWWTNQPHFFQDLFAQGLADAVARAVSVAAGEIASMREGAATLRTPGERARAWFMSAYPLLGALAAGFKLIEDRAICDRMDISVAAVDAQARELYLNPAAALSDAELRFVMAHELLHVGLRHDVRRQGRDPHLWNVACFPAGTWIGDGQPIEHVSTMVRTYQGDLITVETQAGAISCTPEHPLFARRRVGHSYPIQVGEPDWREAKSLGEADYLLVPKIKQTRMDTVIDLSDHIREGADSLGRHTFADRAIKEIPLDEDTAWFIGLYVAEGSASPRVGLTLSATETEIAARAIHVLTQMGYSATTHTKENTLTVDSGAIVLGRWLKQECGASAKFKHIPRVILYHTDSRIRAAFLAGLVEGDGHSRKQTASATTVCMVGTVSERLIADLALLLAQDGIGGSRGILRQGPRMIGKTWTDKELVLHTFFWNLSGIARTKRTMKGRTILSHRRRWRADHHGVWYRVKSVSTTPFSGQVYNLTTADHTYIANSFLVHNCDYVINAWLVEMKVGTLPRVGVLFDPTLAGESAEALYNRMATDMRRYRRLATMRGVGASDVLERRGPEWWASGEGVRLDDFYRSALAQGLTYHTAQARGLLPAGLVEEIQALAQPPIAWDVQLARWFDRFFPPLELHRSYARPSRRQAATPDIPVPRWVPPNDWKDGRTFGVILDTSGSMDRSLLAKALGSIASYAISRDVPAVRVVFCDAVTYDQGYMRAEDIAGEVRVRGRGGTILQPGVDLLERAQDFPDDGPILLITDGFCDKLEFAPRRAHAFLLPEGHSLPFNPKGELFYIR
jgi:predicted metal-dependent peptidase